MDDESDQNQYQYFFSRRPFIYGNLSNHLTLLFLKSLKFEERYTIPPIKFPINFIICIENPKAKALADETPIWENRAT